MTTSRRLAAILAADVAGYSAAMERDEEGTAAAVRALRREVIEPKLAEHQGRLIKTTGDGFLAEFASPISALNCALAIQQRLDATLQLRIGLNLGDMIIEDGGDLLGEGVNIAARLEGLADPGGILVSDKIVREVEGKVEATFEDRGDQQVKNITKPVRVYAVQTGTMANVARPKPGAPLLFREKPSIAVLPFQNMSGDPEQEYFSDGITEDIITNLAKFREFDVIERNSTFGYKGSVIDLARIARELKVDYVVQGSVRSTHGRIRVSAQLVKVENNSNVWAERYDRELVDVFALQDEITARITTAVNPAIRSVQSQAAMRKHPANLAAWDHVWRGLWHVNQFRKEPNLQSRAEFQAAVAQDARCAQAHAWLAMTHVFDAWFNWTDAHAVSLDCAHHAAAEALRCDDTEPVSHVADALQCFWSGRMAQAREAGERALGLNPNSFLANFVVGGSLNYLGQCEAAIGYHLKALDLSPTDPFAWNCFGSLAHTYLNLERYDDAISSADRAIVRRHGYLFGRIVRAAALAYAGRAREAAEAVDTIREITPDFSVARLDHYPFREAQKRHLLAGLTLAGLEAVRTGDAPKPAASGSVPLPDKPSIAVLPFQNMSGDVEQEYFADGIVEDITTTLSRLKFLFVIARNSSFTYKGRTIDIKQVGHELGVRYVLEGSVRRAGNRVRITAQLIEAASGTHLWAERYDRDLADIFAVQEDITASVTTAIAPVLAAAERRNALRKPPDSLDAWEAYHRGMWHFMKQEPHESDNAKPFFQRAIDIDPNFAGGYYGLALTYLWDASAFRTLDLGEGLKLARPLVHRAVNLDDADAMAHFALGYTLGFAGDNESARTEMQRALALDPNHPWAWGYLGGSCCFSGRHQEALGALEKAMQVSPHDPLMWAWVLWVACTEFYRGNDEAALRSAEQLVRLWPDKPHGHRLRIASLGHLGRIVEARSAVQEAMALPNGLQRFGFRAPWLRPQDHARTIEGMRKAGLPE